ncbi:MAG: hypothetical protein JW726_05075, partial [Anaerolineales bacterium]|nr:hypothetical protein [Anaerolineales bacterium]
MERPYIVVNQQASVDGRLAISPDKLLLFGDERWNTIAGADSTFWEQIKTTHKPQTVLEGSGSFCPLDQPPDPLPPVEGSPVSLYQDYLPSSILNRPGHAGWFSVVDGRGRVRWAYKEYPDPAWAGWYPLVLVCRQTPPESLAYLQREEVPYLVAGQQRVD